MKTLNPRSIAYFPSTHYAYKAMQPWIDKRYPNRFQDAQSIARLKVVEFRKGYAIQLGDYGRYLTTLELA